MRGVRTIVTLLLLALWLPASSHSLLETAGLIHDQHDQHDDHDDPSSGSHAHHTDDHEVADGHCLLSSTDVSLPVPAVTLTPLLICLLGIDGEPELGGPCTSGLAPPGVAPPELALSWQFFFRAALPVRAPSLAS